MQVAQTVTGTVIYVKIPRKHPPSMPTQAHKFITSMTHLEVVGGPQHRSDVRSRFGRHQHDPHTLQQRQQWWGVRWGVRQRGGTLQRSCTHCV